MTLDADKVKGSKWVALLPKSEHPWRLTSFGNRVFAVSPGYNPLVLYEDGWKEVQFVEADFDTPAGKLFQDGLKQMAAPSEVIAVKNRPKPWQLLPRSKKKRR